MVNDAANDTKITLAPLGGCTASIKLGADKYMSNEIYYENELRNSYTTNFWGAALDETEYPDSVKTVFDGVTGAATVHCKSSKVIVDTDGNVVVTFIHRSDGQHKLNILGVTLVDKEGNIVAGKYHHGKAGGSLVNNEYTLENVASGEYTLNCYVCDLNGGDNDKVRRAQGKIVVTGVSSVGGITKVVAQNAATTKWIIEEIKDPEDNVYFVTSTNTNGHSTLMLGFPTEIPDDVVAFHGVADGKILTGRYISLESYDNILPANAPVILRNADETIESKEVRFYYTTETAEKVNDSYIKGYLYFNVVNCNQFGDVDVYMMNKSGTTTRMYLTYQNYDQEGNKVTINGTTNHFESGYVTSKANKAFMVLPKETTSSVASLAFTFGIGGGTTDIDEAETELEVIETIFDLQGRRVTEITQPGIYIINGKKVIVK